jgi:DegT/DnrJ/EryC1/StrS aminotransferase family
MSARMDIPLAKPYTDEAEVEAAPAMIRSGWVAEVICPSFTCFATDNAIRHVGAYPVFIEVDPQTFRLNPAPVARAATPKTRAVMAVHQIELAARYDALLAATAVQPPYYGPGHAPVFQSYVALPPENVVADRSRLIAKPWNAPWPHWRGRTEKGKEYKHGT